jgi:hypothetical protein
MSWKDEQDHLLGVPKETPILHMPAQGPTPGADIFLPKFEHAYGSQPGKSLEQRQTTDATESTHMHLLRLPNIRQPDDYSCGAACAMSVGKYEGVGPDSIAEWKTALHTSVEVATHPRNIVGYLTALGLLVYRIDEMDLLDLSRCWSGGKPVICFIQDYGTRVPAKAKFPYGHVVAVIGVALDMVFCFDPSADNVLQGEDSDASHGKVMIDQDKFLEVWHDKDYEGNQFHRLGIIVGKPTHT